MLGLADRIGNFMPGKEADFVLLDVAATPLMARRSAVARNISETLFTLMTLGDDRAVRGTWIAGKRAYG